MGLQPRKQALGGGRPSRDPAYSPGLQEINRTGQGRQMSILWENQKGKVLRHTHTQNVLWMPGLVAVGEQTDRSQERRWERAAGT